MYRLEKEKKLDSNPTLYSNIAFNDSCAICNAGHFDFTRSTLVYCYTTLAEKPLFPYLFGRAKRIGLNFHRYDSLVDRVLVRRRHRRYRSKKKICKKKKNPPDKSDKPRRRPGTCVRYAIHVFAPTRTSEKRPFTEIPTVLTKALVEQTS